MYNTKKKNHKTKQTNATTALSTRRSETHICAHARFCRSTAHACTPPSQRSDWHHHPHRAFPHTHTHTTTSPTLSLHKSSQGIRWLILLLVFVVICFIIASGASHAQRKGRERGEGFSGAFNALHALVFAQGCARITPSAAPQRAATQK